LAPGNQGPLSFERMQRVKKSAPDVEAVGLGTTC